MRVDKNAFVIAKVSVSVKERLDRQASDEGVSRSELIRRGLALVLQKAGEHARY